MSDHKEILHCQMESKMHYDEFRERCSTGSSVYSNVPIEKMREAVEAEEKRQEPTKTAADFLSEGLRILSERGKQYGSEGNERSFAQVAQAFTALTGKQLAGSDVCLILALVKQVRQYAQPRYHHDSAVDSVNYLALQAEELQKERV